MKNNDAVVIGLHPNNDEIYKLIITLAMRNRAEGERIEDFIANEPDEEMDYVTIPDDNNDTTYLKIFCANADIAYSFIRRALSNLSMRSVIDYKDLSETQVKTKLANLAQVG